MNRILTFIASLLGVALILDELFIESGEENFELKMARWESLQESYHSKFISGISY